MSSERATRGRLSSLDLVPEDAQDDVLWAMGELNRRARHQYEILDELNQRLLAKGVEPISRSAFNRRSVRIAAHARRIAESRALFEGIAPQFTPEKIDETNIVIGEMIKILIAELLDAGSEAFTPKGAMEMARAYAMTIQGQHISAEAKRRALAAFKAQVGAAAQTVAKAKGLTAETRAKIMEQLGVIQKAAT
jgi:hypothetical protein